MKKVNFFKKVCMALIAVALVATSVNMSSVNAQAATKKITLSATSKSVNVGKSFTLKVKSATGLKTSKVKFTTSNAKIATVSTSKGTTSCTVKGISKGKVTITAKSTVNSKVIAKCTVTVKQPVTSISMNRTAYALAYKGSVTLKTTAIPSNASDKSVTWKSSNTKVATVSSKGKVTAKSKAGTAKITATTKDGSKKVASCKIVVKAKKDLKKISSIKMSSTAKTLNVKATTKLTATVSPSNATQKTLLWTSSKSSVATVDQKGNVKAVAAGKATITAAAQDGSGKKVTCVVTVVVPETGAKLSSSALSLVEGKTAKLTATVTPSNATNKTVTWKSSDTTVATVSNGTVTAVKAGKATITATTSNGKAASCTVTVTSSKVAVTGVTLTPAATIEKGATSQLTATVSPSNATNKSVTFASSDTSVATVDSTGLVTAVTEGTATITVTTADGAKTATAAITAVSTEGVRVFDGTNYTYTLNKSAASFDVSYGDDSYTAEAQSVFDAIGNLQDTAVYLAGMESMGSTGEASSEVQQLEFLWNKINETTLSQYPGVATASVVDSTDENGNRVKTVTVTTVNDVVRTLELKAPAIFTTDDNNRWININEIGGAERKATLYGMWIQVNDDESQTIYFHVKNEIKNEEPAGGQLVLNISADAKSLTLAVDQGETFASLQETDDAYVLTFEKEMYDKFATSFGVIKSIDDLLVSAN